MSRRLDVLLGAVAVRDARARARGGGTAAAAEVGVEVAAALLRISRCMALGDAPRRRGPRRRARAPTRALLFARDGRRRGRARAALRSTRR